MSINPGGIINHNWNYSNKNKPDFSYDLFGTVVAIQEVQARKFGSGEPDFWEDSGRPKMNIRMVFVDQDGQYKTLTFQPASKRAQAENTGLHMKWYNLSGGSMENLIGRTFHVQTRDAGTDENHQQIPGMPTRYGSGYPRPFDVFPMDDQGPFEASMPLPAEYSVPELLANTAASGGRVVQPAAPQNIQVPQQQAQPIQYVQSASQYATAGNFVPQGQYSQQPMSRQEQPAMQQQPAGTVHPMMPQGMDPQVAQQMQQMGAVNVQPVGPYDNDEVPF